MDKETLMERLEASKRVTEAARRESNCLEKQVEALERKLQSSQGHAQAAEDKLQTFLKKVAGMLQLQTENAVQPTERDVLRNLEKVSSMMFSYLTSKNNEIVKILKIKLKIIFAILFEGRLCDSDCSADCVRGGLQAVSCL